MMQEINSQSCSFLHQKYYHPWLLSRGWDNLGITDFFIVDTKKHTQKGNLKKFFRRIKRSRPNLYL